MDKKHMHNIDMKKVWLELYDKLNIRYQQDYDLRLLSHIYVVDWHNYNTHKFTAWLKSTPQTKKQVEKQIKQAITEQMTAWTPKTTVGRWIQKMCSRLSL